MIHQKKMSLSSSDCPVCKPLGLPFKVEHKQQVKYLSDMVWRTSLYPEKFLDAENKPHQHKLNNDPYVFEFVCDRGHKWRWWFPSCSSCDWPFPKTRLITKWSNLPSTFHTPFG